MIETATLKNANSTIGAFTAPQEQVQTAEPAIETPSVETVNDNIQIEEPAAPIAEVPAQEANEASFAIGFDDEPAAQPPTQPQQSQQINWDEILKQADRKELAKKLGISDFALEIDEHLSRGGSAVDYLNAKAIDWDKISDIDILKSEFSKKYSMLDAEMQEHLFNKKYGISELDDDDAKREKVINQRIDAAQIRAEKKSEASKFKLPETQTPTEQNKELAEMQTYLQQEQQKAEAAKQYIASHPSVQNLLQSKRVAVELGEGIRPFNFNIDKPELVIKAILDGSFYKKVITNEKGELNVDKLLRITKYALNPDQHDKSVFNYGKSHGVKTLVEEGQNAKRPNGTPVPPASVTLTEAFNKNARNGKIGDHFKLR